MENKAAGIDRKSYEFYNYAQLGVINEVLLVLTDIFLNNCLPSSFWDSHRTNKLSRMWNWFVNKNSGSIKSIYECSIAAKWDGSDVSDYFETKVGV